MQRATEVASGSYLPGFVSIVWVGGDSAAATIGGGGHHDEQLLRMHFIDIPSSFQNQIGGDTGDIGLQFKYQFDKNVYGELELLSDPHGRLSSQVSLGGIYETGNWRFRPEASLLWKETAYNSYYYGLTLEPINAGVDIKFGSTASYHVASHLE